MAVAALALPRLQLFDASGNPLAGGLLDTFAAGTTTPLASYTDSTGITPNPNPVVADSGGFLDVWLTTGVSYKTRCRTNGGVTLWTVDGITLAAAVTGLPTGVTMTTTTVTLQASTFNGQGKMTSAGFLQAGKFYLACRLVVTQSFGTTGGLTTLAVGYAGTVGYWGTGLALTTNTTNDTTKNNLLMPSVATDLEVVSEGGVFDATGACTVTSYQLTLS